MADLQGLKSALADKRVTPAMPADRNAVTYDDEETGGEHRDEVSGCATFVTYRDAEGRRSQRRITCKSLSGDGRPIYLHGYCHERKAARTFKIARIEELVDYRTGEVVEAERHFQELRMHGLVPMRDRGLADLAVTMVFMARCDGDFHPLEEEAIEHGLTRYLLRTGGNDNEIEKVIGSIPAIAPDGDDVVSAISRLLKAASCPSIVRLILDCSGDVMKADGHYRSEEAVWSSKLCGILRERADLQT